MSTTTTNVFSQAIQDRAAEQPVQIEEIHIHDTLPAFSLKSPDNGSVQLLPGLFQDRRELNKAYILSLKNENLLQNHLLEAGIRLEAPYETMHQGWEAPYCQLRGHFAGHWLSAAAHYTAIDHDPFMAQRVKQTLAELKKCQNLNGDGWVGSIPEKFFTIMEEDRTIWSPQYTVHKTLMGLYDAYAYTGSKEALEVEALAAEWYIKWTDRLVSEGKSDVIYRGESSGMLELWADLYGATGDERYLKLASRYAKPDMFRQLLEGKDPLSNGHANASIPWIHGAARLYELTGDEHFRNIVEAFWKCAVTDRGMFATTGNNAGEFWIPQQQFHRFLGNRTQEHCTVYNMIRVAQFLYNWTGDSQYADYIERALYNGILAQQNPDTGMVSYFLPTEPGGKKNFCTPTSDFWCCTGTLVQAHAMYEELTYSQSNDDISVLQFIPSQASFGKEGQQIHIQQILDDSDNTANFTRTDARSNWTVQLDIVSEITDPWTLSIRQPAWALDTTITIDGKPVEASLSDQGFLQLKRTWSKARVRVSFTKEITREPLPGDPSRFALLDGPMVLAALIDQEPIIADDLSPLPLYEHQYVSGREWQTSHYMLQTSLGSVKLVPIHEIADQPYTLYFKSED